MSSCIVRLSRSRAVAVAMLLPLVAALPGCRRTATDVDPRMVSAWVKALYGVFRVERLSPPVASRFSAYASSALYSGMAAVHTSMRPLSEVLPGAPAVPRAERPADVDATIVAVAAERVVMDSLLREGLATTRSQVARLADSLTAARVTDGVSPEMRARSDSLGYQIGLAIVNWSRTDGFTATRGRPYVPPKGEGLWYNDSPGSVYSTQNMSGASESVEFDNPANQQRAGNTGDRGLILSRPKPASAKTLPAANMAGATEPYWSEVRPFLLSPWNACPMPDAPAYSTDTASALYRNARAVFDTKASLTDAQRTTAYYWADNAGESGTPVGHWLSIAAQMISERNLDAEAAVRLVFATSVSQADAFIATWGYKYRDNLLRPRMYIRRVIDPKWEPLIPTPPFPEHPSGHSAQSSAAAAAITGLIGSSAFTDSTSVSIGHAVRSFTSFQQASEEAGMSRIYGGIHYPSGNEAGQALGRCIGEKVAAAFGAGASAGAAR